MSDDDYFFFENETKTHISVILVRFMAMTPELPDYCDPKTNLLWTKGIPATTSFRVPIERKSDIAEHLKSQKFELKKN